jgi:hypothetical protein
MWIRFLSACLCAGALWAQSAGEEREVVAVAQKFMDVLAARDPAAGKAILVPEARYFTIRPDGTMTAASLSEVMDRLPARTERLLERMFEPLARVSGRIAMVWAPYDFHRDGKFSHCGVDVFTLLKTAAGWRIASLAYTVEPSGCPQRPAVH